MNVMKTTRRWIGTALVAYAATLSPASASPAVRVDVDLAHPVMLAGRQQNAYLRVALTGTDGVSKAGRTPVNVVIVLDQSGSMQGQKIEEAKRAAIMALDRLRADDIVSVVTYQSTVDVLVPATKLSDREKIRAAIGRIRAGGSTALFAGVSKGAQELRKFFDRDRVNRVILLSDGIANVGPSSPEDLADLGASLAREGITVTTIGLGLGYNEDLMTRLAFKSDGNHFFVENARDLELAYATEFGDVLSVVAQDVDVEITCPQGIRPVRTLGREGHIDGRKIRTSLNQVYRDQTKYLLVELEVPPGVHGRTTWIADVDVSYADLATRSRQRLGRRAAVSFSNRPDEVERNTDARVMVSVVAQLGAERNELAMALRDEGKVDEARKMFVANQLYLEQKASEYDDDQLQKDALANEEASRNLDAEKWKRARKAISQYQHKTKQQGRSMEKKDD